MTLHPSFLARVRVVLLGQGGRAVVGAVSALVVAGMVGPDSKGVLALLVGVATIYVVLASAGLNASIPYYLGRGTWTTGMASTVVVWGTVWVAVSSAVLGAIAVAVGPLHDLRLWWIIAACSAQALSTLHSTLLMGEHRFREFSAQTVLAPALTLLAFLVGSRMLGWGPTDSAVNSWILGVSVACLPSFVTTIRRANPTLQRPVELAPAISYGIRSGLASAMNVLNMRLDVVLLGMLVPSAAIGVYALAVQFSELLLIVPASIGYVLFPHVASSSAQGDDGTFTARLCRLTLIVGAAASIPLVAGAGALVWWWLEGYRESVALIAMLVPGTVLFTIARIAGNDVSGRGLPVGHIWAALASVAVTIVGNLVLIPRIGVAGAAITSSTAYAVYAVAIGLWFSRATGVGLSTLFIPRRDDLGAAVQFVRQTLHVRRRTDAHGARSSAGTEPGEFGALRIALVSYHFVPGTAAGALRPHALARGLVQRGHSVTVYTGEAAAVSDGYEVVRVRHRYVGDVVALGLGLDSAPQIRRRFGGGSGVRARFMSRVIAFAKSVAAHPDEFSSWERMVVDEARRRIDAGECYDVVLGTSPPVSALYAAKRIAEAAGCPWVADFRDLWTDNPYYQYGSLRRRVDRVRERSLLASAERIVTVNRYLADVISSRSYGPPATTVYTGVTPRAQGARTTGPRRPLKVVHTGNLYDGKRDITDLIGALVEGRRSGAVGPQNLQVDFYGRIDEPTKERVRIAGIEDMVRFHGVVSRVEVFAALDDADAGLLVLWDDPGDAGSLPSKLIEYLLAGLPVIALGVQKGGEVERLASECPSIDVCSGVETLLDCIERRVGTPPTEQDREKVRAFATDRFSPDAMTAAFVAELASAHRSAGEHAIGGFGL